ncbi:MAG: hypothetical protein QOG85_1857 [Gaiellaceae bacterium]|nr:hypothetical protein [Gaiellaceae bacterium]
MPTIEKTIDVDVPVSTAYTQWTQFEEFPSFMNGVDEVRQLDDTHLHWVASVAGKQEEWDAEITEQTRDQKIAWMATGGKQNAGVVTFQPLGDSRTKITLRMEWETEGMVEALGSMLGQDGRQVQSDLEQFKELVETRDTGVTRDTGMAPDPGMTPDTVTPDTVGTGTPHTVGTGRPGTTPGTTELPDTPGTGERSNY